MRIMDCVVKKSGVNQVFRVFNPRLYYFSHIPVMLCFLVTTFEIKAFYDKKL